MHVIQDIEIQLNVITFKLRWCRLVFLIEKVNNLPKIELTAIAERFFHGTEKTFTNSITMFYGKSSVSHYINNFNYNNAGYVLLVFILRYKHKDESYIYL